MATPLGRFLIVDDEPEVASVLHDVLTALGYQADGFTSAPAALVALKQGDYDVLLADLVMPEMDGLALLRAALELDASLVSIIMTGYGTVQTAVDAMKLGAFDFVLKPFKAEDIAPVLTRAMQIRRLRLENVRLRETVAIFELSRTVVLTLDLSTILNKAVQAAAQQTQADNVSLLLSSASGDELYVAAAFGAEAEAHLGERMSVQQGTAGWLARPDEPIARESLWVPMLAGGKLQGVLRVEDRRRRRPFTLGEVKALTILTGIVGPAMENARLLAQVREAEGKYRSVFENAAEGIFQLALDGHFRLANPALARMLGYATPEDLLSDASGPMAALFADPDDWAHVNRLLEARGQVEGYEFRAHRRDQETIWLSANLRAERDVDSRLTCYEGTLEDITDRKHKDEALELGRERLELALHGADLGMYDWNPQTGAIFADARYLEMLGYGPGEIELTADCWWKWIHPDDVPVALPGCRGFQDGTLSAAETEFRLRHKSGEWVWILDRGRVISRDEQGRPTRVIGTHLDITSRKRAEAALAEERNLLRTLIDALPDHIYVKDRDGRTLLANVAQARALRLDHPDELIGRADSEFPYSPDALAAIRRNDLAAMEAGEPVVAEESYVSPAGDERSFSTFKTPLRDLQGNVIGVVGISHDLTERKKVEQEVRQERDRAEQYLNTVEVVLMARDMHGAITLMNRKGHRLLGYADGELLGQNWVDTCLPARVREETEAVFRRLLAGEADALEYRENPVVTARGEERLIAWHNTPLKDDTGRIVGILSSGEDITERRQAEEALRQANAYNRSLIEASLDPLVTIGPDGKITDVNSATETATGYPRQQLIGTDFIDYFTEPEQARAGYRQVFQDGQVRDYPLELRHRDGQVMSVRYNASVYRDESGQVTGVFAAARDITERKRAAEALELARERLELALHGADLGMYEWNIQTGAVFVDARYLEMIGYEPGEIEFTADAWLARIHPDDLASARSGLQGFLDGTRLFAEAEYRLRHKSGAWVWVQDRGRVVGRDGQGRPLRLIGTHLDVTARRRAEEQLRYQANLVDTVAEAVIATDLQFNVVSWNPAAETIYGWTADEVVGRRLDDFVQTEYITGNLEDARRRLFEAESWTGEVIHRRRDGAPIHIQSSVSLVKDAQGRPTGMVGINRDITAQKQAEEAVRQSEERFRLLADHARDIIFRYRLLPAPGFEYVSPACRMVSGCTPEEFAANPEPWLGWALRPGQAPEVPDGPSTIRWERKDGQTIWVETLYTPVYDVAGRLVAVEGAIRDVTERKLAEERLRELSGHLHAALEAERTQIARDIHDEFAQTLTALKIDVAWLSKQLPAERPDCRDKTARMSDQIDATIDMVRRVATALRPGMLDDLGLAAAIEWQAQEFAERTGIDCDLYLSEANGELERDLATALFRIFQEALTNVARHARATEVRVTLAEAPGELTLIVQDNGRGISDRQAADPHSLGLIGMVERVRPWGGRVTVAGEPGRGTTVTVRVPRPREEG